MKNHVYKPVAVVPVAAEAVTYTGAVAVRTKTAAVAVVAAAEEETAAAW